jgi:hypothetical protein
LIEESFVMTRLFALLLLLLVSFPGSSTLTLTVNGTGFVSGAVVNWNGSPRPTTFISSSQVTAQISSVDVAQKGTNSVSVVNPGPGGGASNLTWFAVTAPTPGITLARNSGVASPAGAYAVVTGDFNRDGKADTAILGSSHKQIALVIGGSVPTQTINLGLGLPSAQPIQVAIGDFNGDGNPDLVAAAGPVWVLLGNGNGTFRAPVKYLADSLSGQVVVRDIDSDGTLDLVLGSQSKNGMNPVLLGNGDGTFRNGTGYAGGTDIESLVADDFNGDGVPDLALVPDLTSQQVCVKFGNGDGTFYPGPCTAVATATPPGMTVADFNGDGNPDLVITPNFIALGNGDGTFVVSQQFSQATSLAVADLNGDGKEDLVFTLSNPAVGLNVFLGNGDGTFGPRITKTFPSSTHSVAVADFNGDGRLDIVGSKQGSLDLQAPAVILSTKALTFPTTKVGRQSDPKSVIVTNSGSAGLLITSVTVDNADYLFSHDCPNVVEAGAFCTAIVIFQPSIVGLDLGALTIVDNTANGGIQKVKLHGTGK